MMKKEWGSIPKKVWQEADAVYGMTTVVKGLDKALSALTLNPEESIEVAVRVLKMKKEIAYELVMNTAKELQHEIENIA